MSTVYVIGIGPGDPRVMTHEALACASGVSTLFVLERSAKTFEGFANLVVASSLSDLAQRLAASVDADLDVGVAVSGSVTFHSFAAFLMARFPEVEIKLIQGISSIDYLLAKVQVTESDICKRSLHGKGFDLSRELSVLSHHACAAYLLDPVLTPERLAAHLVDAGFPELSMTVGENLSYEDEHIVRGTAREIASQRFGGLCVALVEGIPGAAGGRSNFGRASDEFVREKGVPITKEEVRSVILSKLRLCEATRLWDIGAGTGSVGIEAALLYPQLDVEALEKNDYACAVIQANLERFDVQERVRVVLGTAPNDLGALHTPSHVFIGGSSGNLASVIQALVELDVPLRVVVSATTLKTAACAEELLSRSPFGEYEMVQIAVSRNRELGGFQLMGSENAIFIASATLSGKTRVEQEQ